MTRSDGFRLERQLAGRASHPLGASALARRTLQTALTICCGHLANSSYVGCTAGRGRCTPRGTQVPPKRIFLRHLNPRWRRLLKLSGPAPKPVPESPERGPLGPADGLNLDQWAQNEFGGAPLGDVRLGRRLVRSASVQSAKPMASFPRAAEGDLALVRGHYRLIDKPDQSAVTVENILAPHRERTLRRMRGQQTVLLVQDGTDLNFAEHSAGKGLGLIGKNQHSQGSVGLHMHSTLAISEGGLPLGVTRVEFDRTAQGGQPERVKPVEERKTGRWLRGLRDSAELVAGVEDRPQMVAVLDREGDAFALFREQGQLDGVELLVRARHNRVLDAGGAKLFDKLRAAPAQATLQIQVDRQSARRGTRRQGARPARAARRAVVGLRWQTVRLPAPDTDSQALEMQVVHVREYAQPESGPRLEWLLLTTCAVDSQADAERVLGWYRQRWRIEDWHRVLKSGCKVELLQHRSVERIERAVAIRAVIAWRLMVMTLVGRQTPELPADLLFTETELMVLRDFAHDRKLPTPDNVGQAVRTMAMMGGYLNRKGDPPPGHQKLWEGHIDLAAEARCYGRILRMGEHSLVIRKLAAE